MMTPWTHRHEGDYLHDVVNNVGEIVAQNLSPREAEETCQAVNAHLGLLTALRAWPCASCGGSGTYLNRARKRGLLQATELQCKVCEGSRIHPTALAAIRKAQL